jgi:hypothetical protein
MLVRVDVRLESEKGGKDLGARPRGSLPVPGVSEVHYREDVAVDAEDDIVTAGAAANCLGPSSGQDVTGTHLAP